MKISTTMKLRKYGNIAILIMAFIFSSASSFAQLTVTKTYTAPSSVSVDGCGTYCTNLPGLSFSAADFTPGVCQVADVNVSITWAKTDGTCAAPGTGSSFHNEVNFRIDGPTANEILMVPGTYSGVATMSSVTTTLDQAASTTIGGVNPVSGTFKPNNGNLDNYIGTNPFGVWVLRAGDTGAGDPLCIVGYSVTITMSMDTDADGDNYSICQGDCDDNDPLVNPGATEILCDGIDNDCNPLTLDDVSLPTALCQTSVNAYLNAAGLATITGAEVDMGSSDTCSTVTFAVTPSTFTCADIGTQNVTLTVTDASGNSATCPSTVMVFDTLGPTPDVSSLLDINAPCQVDTITTIPTATDNCTGATVTVTNNAVYPITGSMLITWFYEDGTGNVSTQLQYVFIEDNVAPVPNVATLPSYTFDCDVTVPAPTATDACFGTVTGTTTTVFPHTTMGTSIVTWVYTDGNGNTSTQDQVITVTDMDAPIPVVATLPDVNGVCEVTPTAPMAMDNCIGNITGTTTTPFPITALGSTTITWSYVDGNGNTTTQDQTIIVTNITATTTASADGVTLTSDLTGTSYQWINCSTNMPIVGATNANYTATANGSYAVVVSDGLCSDTSDCATVSTVSVDALIIDNLKLHPNPTRTGFFNITFDGVIHSITVLDMSGREVLIQADLNTGSVDASKLNNGKYFVRVETNKGTKVTEIIISM